MISFALFYKLLYYKAVEDGDISSKTNINLFVL